MFYLKTFISFRDDSECKYTSNYLHSLFRRPLFIENHIHKKYN